MNLARIKVMSMVICALCKVQQVAYTKLAAAFDNEAAASSSLRRIQRFIAEFVIDTDLIAKLILKLIPVSEPYDLAIDRTNWKFSDTNINILTLGIIYEGMAFPVVFKMMDKRGEQEEKYRNGEITREEYDQWRYNYPKYDTSSRWAKVPSQEISDLFTK